MSKLHHTQNGRYSKAKACKRKLYAHATQGEAQAHLDRLVRAGAFRPRLNVYQCKDRTCLKWHVGHLLARKV